jgi:hypothetical protein
MPMPFFRNNRRQAHGEGDFRDAIFAEAARRAKSRKSSTRSKTWPE